MTEPERPPGLALVLPRAWLQAQVVQAHRTSGLANASPSGDITNSQYWLAHGSLVLQTGWRQRMALAGPLRAGAPRPLPVRSRTEDALLGTLSPANHDGLFLLTLTSPGAEPPATQAAWEGWLHAHAPDFRLACDVRQPAVAVLWLRADGLAYAALREHGGWQQIDRLLIKGARFAQASLPEGKALQTVSKPMITGQNSTVEAQNLPTQSLNDAISDYASDRRDSRLAAALGHAVLNRLQTSRIAVVGTGRTGSILAHGLARLGVGHLLVIDCDHMEAHNLDGDLPPHFEGRPKVEALSRFLRPLLRPGATLDARRLPIASPVAGSLISEIDLVIACVDNDAARLWANAWALACHINLLAITTGQHTDANTSQRLAAAELRLLPAGTGCLACLGGFAQADTLLSQLENALPEPTPANVTEQRAGSLRSWAGIAANMGLRMVEQLVGGELDRALFRRLQETPDGGLRVEDSSLPPLAPNQTCGFCGSLLGAGQKAVTPERVRWLAKRALG